MSSRSKIISIIVAVIVLISGGLFAYAYYAGWISPKADVINVSNDYLREELKQSGYILIKQSDLDQSIKIANSTKKSQNLTQSISNEQILSAKVNEKISEETNKNSINNEGSFDNIVIITNDLGDPISLDTYKTDASNIFAENKLTFSYDDSWSNEQKQQLSSIVEDVYPRINKLYGPPAFNDNITIRPESCNAAGLYYPGTNPAIALCVTDPQSIDLNNIYYKHLLSHEIIHAFHGNYIFGDSSWEEGMTVAANTIIMNDIRNWGEISGSFYDYESLNNAFQNYDLPSANAYNLGSVAFIKLYYEDNNFFKNYNKIYYEARADNYNAKVSALFNTISEVEDQSIQDWYANQHIFHNYQGGKIEANIFIKSPHNGQFIGIRNVSSAPIDVKVSLYDYQNNLLGQKEVQNISNNYINAVDLQLKDFSGFDIDKQQILRAVFEYDDQKMESYGVNISSDKTKGIFGIITHAIDGVIQLTKIDDATFPSQSTNIINGTFSFGDQTIENGKYKLTYTIDGKTYSKSVSKAQDGYYVMINTHAENDMELQDINNSLSNLQIKLYNTGVTNNFNIINKSIAYSAVHNTNSYFENKKIYDNKFALNINNLVFNTNYANSIYVYLSDGFLIKKNNDIKTSNMDPFTYVSSTPQNNSSDANVNDPIEVIFNRDIDPGSVGSNIVIYPSSSYGGMGGGTGNSIPKPEIDIQVQGNKLIIQPKTPLAYNAQYYMSLNSLKDTFGNSIEGSSYSINFTTQIVPGSTKPEILSFTPLVTSTDIDTLPTISLESNNELDETLLDKISYNLNANYNNKVDVSMVYDKSAKKLSFTPLKALDYNKRYNFSISNLVDAYGNNFIPYSYSTNFTTKTNSGTQVPQLLSTEPTNNATDVACNKNVKLNFNVPIDISTFLKGNISIYPSTIDFNIGYENQNQTIVIVPVGQWVCKKNIYIYARGDIKDINGNTVFPTMSNSLTFTTSNKFIGQTDPDKSSLSIEKDADNINYINKQYKIAVKAIDLEGNPVKGKNIVFASSRNTDQIINPTSGGGGVTNDNGETFGNISASETGTSEISAIDISSSDKNISLTNRLSVNFIAPPIPSPTPTVSPTPSPSPTYLPISAQKIKLKKGNNSMTFPYIEGTVKITGAEKGDLIAFYNTEKNQYEFYNALTDIGKIKPGKGYLYIASKDKTVTISGNAIKSPVAIFLPTSGYYYIGNPFTKELDVSRITITYPDKIKPDVIKTTSLLNAVKTGLIDKNLYTQLNSTPIIIKSGFKLPAFKGYWLKTKSSNISIVFNP